MARHKNIPDLAVNNRTYRPRTRPKRYKALKATADPSTYRLIYLCPVAACSQPLGRKDGFIVCSANPWHYTQKIIPDRVIHGRGKT